MNANTIATKTNYFHWLADETSTSWWHDSADPAELEVALANKATGVTTNPILAATALQYNPGLLPKSSTPDVSADDRAEMNLKSVVQYVAGKLEPQFEKSGHKQGYVCAQVNPGIADDRQAMISTARRFHSWAPNISVKFPATAAGLDALEECIAEGICITSTVNFTVSQVLSAAERHRRGQERAKQAGKRPGECFAVVMIGRLDDYLRNVAHDNQSPVSEEDLCQAGLAVVKRSYFLFKERQYEATLLIAALRGPYHLTELAGGDLIMSVHPAYQKPFLTVDIPQKTRIDVPIAPEVITRLSEIADFKRAYDPNGMTPKEFITYGVVQKTLMQFQLSGWAPLQKIILDK